MITISLMMKRGNVSIFPFIISSWLQLDCSFRDAWGQPEPISWFKMTYGDNGFVMNRKCEQLLKIGHDPFHSSDWSIYSSLRSELEGGKWQVTIICLSSSALISECRPQWAQQEREFIWWETPDQKPAFLKSHFNGPLISWSAIKGSQGDLSIPGSLMHS